jgi:NitT/TauT family transport system permease protein
MSDVVDHAIADSEPPSPMAAWSTQERTTKEQRAARREGRLTWWERLIQLGILGAILLTWELLTTHNVINPILNATPAQVWHQFVDIERSGELWTALKASLVAVFLAFLLSAVVGAPVGIALALLPRVERIVSPFLDALNATPRVILAPVFIVAFGISTSAKVAVGFSLCIFIMIVNSRSGVRAVDEDVILLATSLGAKKREIFTKILMPAALPGVFAGLRLSLIFAIFGVVASELISSTSGLGYLAAKYSNQFNMAAVYAVILVLIVVGTAANALMRIVERRLMRWAPRGGEL